jgi:HemY protein
MRTIIWVLGLFSFAVLWALVLGNHRGTITLFWPPHRVDISLNLFVLSVSLGFVFFYAAVRGILLFVAMPRRAHEWRQRRKERAMHRALLDALSLSLGGRYVRARKAAEQALELEAAWQQGLQNKGGAAPANQHAKLRALAHWQLAESAHALQNQALRDQHAHLALQCSSASAQSADLTEGLQLRQVRWALDDTQAGHALEQLQALPHALTRRTLALRLKLKAARQSGQAQIALEAARALVKHGAFSPGAGQTLLAALLNQALAQCSTPEQLAQWVQGLPAPERNLPQVLLRASERWLALDGSPEQASAWLQSVWHTSLSHQGALPLDLIKVLSATLKPPSDEWLKRLEQAQNMKPQDAGLHHLLGMVCLRRQLWGKAQQHLQRALTLWSAQTSSNEGFEQALQQELQAQTQVSLADISARTV